jgi:DNA repair exonuclease SbcCD nuclease subunit
VLAAATHDAPAADLRLLCLHQCVEGATCGPGNFTFRFGPDVIRAADLPRDLAVTLCGHVHRHQVLRPPGRAPIVYAGSIERTSFAEAPETKGFVVLELTHAGLAGLEFRPLPARPMVTRTLSFDGTAASETHAHVAAAIESTPHDAVVQLRITGTVPPTLTAAALREIAGARNVTLAPRPGRPEGLRYGNDRS